MMKHFSLLLIGALLLSMVVGAQAFEKTILVEYFTNVNCGPCAGQHDPIEDMLNNYTRDEIAYITYHTSWPSSSDGYYVGNIPENTGRWNYYGVNYVPWFQCEGLWGDYSQLNSVLPIVTPRIGTYTPYQIEFEPWPEAGPTVPITATLTCAEATQGDMRFNFILVDKSMVVPVGSNGVDDYSYNMIDMAYNYTGQVFTSVGGNEEIEYTYDFSIPNNNTFGNLGVVAMVQNYSTGEIFQARYISSPEVVIQGTVTHAVTGLPMWLAVVQLNDGLDQDITGQDGTWSFGGLVEDTYYIDVFMAGYEQLTTTPAFLNYGTHQFDLEITNLHDAVDMVSSVGSDDDVMGAFEVNDIAYLAMGYDGLSIVNVSDLANPVVLGALDLGDDVQDVVVDGDYAYLAAVDGIYSVDVSNPAAPVEVDNVPTLSSAFNIDKSGNHLFVACSTIGMLILNASNPTNLQTTYILDTPGYARDIVVSGSYALVADGSAGLSIFDVNPPTSPSLAGTYDTNGYAGGVEVSGTTAYLADDSQGVKAVDVSNPNSPSLVAEIDITGRAKQLAIVDNFLFVAEYTDGFYAYDISNPGNVSQVGYSLTPGTTNNVNVFGGNAYVADSGNMLLFDVSGLGNNVPALLELTGINTEIPAQGGVLSYEAHFEYNLPNPANGIDYWAMVVPPTGPTLGPVMRQPFNAIPGMDITQTIQHQVPGNLGAGEYIYRGIVGNYPNGQLVDTFTFTKAGNAVDGNIEFDISDWTTIGGFTELASGSEDALAIPVEYALENAYPNPFNPTTTVYVALPEVAELSVGVYNVLGQQVAVLANDRMNAGRHALTFDASGMASGLYFIRASVPGHMNEIQKIMLVR
jgi:hypothetical protein